MGDNYVSHQNLLIDSLSESEPDVPDLELISPAANTKKKLRLKKGWSDRRQPLDEDSNVALKTRSRLLSVNLFAISISFLLFCTVAFLTYFTVSIQSEVTDLRKECTQVCAKNDATDSASLVRATDKPLFVSSAKTRFVDEEAMSHVVESVQKLNMTLQSMISKQQRVGQDVRYLAVSNEVLARIANLTNEINDIRNAVRKMSKENVLRATRFTIETDQPEPHDSLLPENSSEP